MRHVYLLLLVALTGVLFMFELPNLEATTVQLLSASLTLPLSLLLAAVCVLGMSTGGLLPSLVRGWARGVGIKSSGSE